MPRYASGIRVDKNPLKFVGISATYEEQECSTDLYIGECCTRVMAQPADQLSGVTVVIGVAAVRRVQAQVSAFLRRIHFLVHAVHRFENASC